MVATNVCCCSRFMFSMVFAMLAAAATAADAPKDDGKKSDKQPLKIIKPDEAKDHDGEDVIVEFKVADAREIDRGVCFLNSTTDRQDPKRFTAFITGKGLKKFKEDPKTEKPAEMFKGKKIQVTGAIKVFNKQYEIEVDSPDQIKIVDEEKKDNATAEKKP